MFLRRVAVALALTAACSPPVVSGGGPDAALDAADHARPADTHDTTDVIDSTDVAATNDVTEVTATDVAEVIDACTPTRSTCNTALECGAIPNGCPGGVVSCPPCGGGETWCQTLAMPLWRSRVSNCVTSVSSANPSWFDPTMTCRTGFMFVVPSDAMAFVAAVASCANGSGAVAIVDPNAPSNEIRVRGTADDVADNYSVILYGSGCSSNRYTSSCTPSFF